MIALFSRNLVAVLALLGGLAAATPALAQSAATEGQKLAFDRGKGNCLTCHLIKGGEYPGNIGPELIDMKGKDNWDKSRYIDTQSWAIMPGEDKAESGVSEACAKQLSTKS